MPPAILQKEKNGDVSYRVKTMTEWYRNLRKGAKVGVLS